MKSTSIKLILILFISGIIISCSFKKETEGPYFGNGFHNGWADQHSIVIWTRLTQNPDANDNMNEFIELSRDTVRYLDYEADTAKILAAQLPEGITLDEMNGGCPGAVGEVKLTC